MLEKIREIICEYVDVDPSVITEDANLRNDIGASSFDLMNIAVALEKEYGITLSNSDLPKTKTIGDVISLVSGN